MTKPPSKFLKRLEILGVVVFFFFLIASYFELPPISYFIKFYCRVFETEKYPLILMAIIPTVALLTLIILIKKLISNKPI